MTDSPQVKRLRGEFDESFAHAIQPSSEQRDMLVVRVGSSERAVRLSQVSRVVRNSGTLHVPARAASFLGVTALRGSVLPVFSLAGLLGTEVAGSDWLLVLETPGHETVAFACDQLTGFVRLDKSQSEAASVIEAGGERYSVIDLHELRSQLELAARSKHEDGQ